MQLIALLFIGFSICSAPLLILREWITEHTAQTWISKFAAMVLIVGLVAIQWLNLQVILGFSMSQYSVFYVLLLYCIGPSFYLYSYQILKVSQLYNPLYLLHYFPITVAGLMPLSVAVPLAFVIGSVYLVWLAKAIFLIRDQRSRFKLELLSLGALFCIALAVVCLGFIWPIISNTVFVLLYSVLIGLAFLGVLLTLLIFPNITSDVVEAAQAAYAQSTLKHIDSKTVVEHLTQLMQQDKLYRLETINLSIVAEQLGLSSHQLSELINTEYQLGFSKFIRQFRIDEAKILLIEEPKASILSIGLSVGFSSQSNFYSAFRDIVGITPGQYREQHL